MTERPSADQRDSATFSALAMVLFVGLGILGLIALVLPQVLWIVLIAAALGSFAVMHYFLWGRWLTNKLQAEELARTESQKQVVAAGHSLESKASELRKNS